MVANRIRFGAGALVISGGLFAIYPALRPFSDEMSLLGAAAFGSAAWLASHMLAIVAFTLLPLGLLGLQRSLRGTSAERLLFVAIVLSVMGTGFTLPFYGGETYGLHALGQEALRLHTDALLGLVEVIRSGPGLVMFLAGLLLLAASAIATATALWRCCRYPKVRHSLRRWNVLVHSAIFRLAAPSCCTWTAGRSRLRMDGRLSLAAREGGPKSTGCRRWRGNDSYRLQGGSRYAGLPELRVFPLIPCAKEHRHKLNSHR